MKKLFFLLVAFAFASVAQAQSGLVGISPTKTVAIPEQEAIAYLFDEQVGPTIKKASYLEEWDVAMHTAQGRGLLLAQMNRVNEQSNFALTGGREIEITAEMAKEIWLKYYHHVLLVDANGDPVSLNLYGIVGEGQDPESFNRMAHTDEGAWAFLVKTSEGKSAYILSLSDFCLNTFAFKIPDLSGVTFVKRNEGKNEEPKLSDDSEDVDEKGGDSETDVTVETDGKTIIIKNNIHIEGATATITNSGNSTNTGGNSTVAPSGQGNKTAPTLWDTQVPVVQFQPQQQPQYQQPQQQMQQGGGQCNHGMNNCSCNNYVANQQVVRAYPPGTGFANVVGAIGTLATGAGAIMIGTAALNGQFQDQNSFTFNGTGTTTNPGFTPVGVPTNGSGFGPGGIGTGW